MALIVEDGSIVADANSYNTVDALRAYAALRGVVLPAEDAAVEVLSFKAMDYLNSLEYVGYIVEETQALPFPRKRIWLNGYELPEDEIPAGIKAAQCQLVMIVSTGVDLFPTTNTGTSFVTKKKVGPLEQEFSEAVYLSRGDLPNMPAVDALLRPFLAGGGFPLRSVRV